MKQIVGYKGGGKGGSSGGSRTPVESPDTLRSRAYARVIDALGEGEWEGPAKDGLKWYYLDETPIQNDDGTYNFTGVTVATRNGTQDQGYFPGFPATESETPVNVQVEFGAPVVRTITSSVASSVRVTVSVPQLSDTSTTTGDTNGSSVNISISLQPDGGSYSEVINDTITGKTTTKYQRSYVIQLTGTGPWNVKVERITADSGRQTLQNQTYWESYTEIADAKLRYPNTAMVASVIDSQQFSAIPKRGFDWKMLRAQIPSNATVDPDDGHLTYTGTWDGTFQIAWNTNPAWMLWDMVINNRYGLGDYINTAQLDKWELYTIGQYCDELVPDGFGGMEPRFSVNIFIQTQNEAFQLLQDICSIFRGISYWSNGAIQPAQDAPSDAVKLFTNANVIDGVFRYMGTSLKTRHSVVLVSWNDPNDFFRAKPEYVEDADAIARYGITETAFAAIGCKSRGQANRAGRWLLYTEANETGMVVFRAAMDAVDVRPYNIIKIQDQNRAGARRGGRVVSATTTAITVDQAFAASVGVAYTLYIRLPDGTVESRSITSIVGNVITVGSALSSAPQPDAIWMVDSDELALQQFRVVSIVEDGEGNYEVTAAQYNPSKFDYIENGLILETPKISTLNDPPPQPENIAIDESLYSQFGQVRVLITAACDATPRATSYLWSYTFEDNNPVSQQTTSPNFEIRDAAPGSYVISVQAISLTGKRSISASKPQTILGKTALPGNVRNFTLANISNGVALLTFSQSVDLDVVIGGFVRVRHSPDSSATIDDWSNAIDIGPAVPGAATQISLPLLSGTYMAKFVDSSGNASSEAVIAVATAASLVTLNVVDTVTESPSFSGAKDNTTYDGALTGLIIDDLSVISTDDILEDWDYINNAGVVAAGTYEFDDYFDLGAVYTSTLSLSISVTGYDTADLIDDRTDLIDNWLSVDGDLIDDVNARLFIRTTDDDPAGTPVWSEWQEFFTGQYTARAFEFKLALVSKNPTHNIIVQALSVQIDMPDRDESSPATIASGTSPYAAVFANAFKEVRAIQLTPHNMATGDYFQVTSISETGFTVAFKNIAGTGVSRNFDYSAKGYGYRQ